MGNIWFEKKVKKKNEKKKKKNLDSSAIIFYPDGNLFERKGERVRTRNEEMSE
jgi:hypothetical protein